MTKAIQQSVRFPVPARRLYDLWVSPRGHAAFTGGSVRIGPRVGDRFSAFEGMISGSTLFSVPSRLLVQRWRGHHWKKSDADSILIVEFVQDGKNGRIDLIHVNVPKHDHAGVTRGWKKYYWGPLRSYLNRETKKKGSQK
jgi:activator of HSP90 ATPase